MDYHEIDFNDIVLWDHEQSQPHLPTDISNAILILDHNMFWHFFEQDILLHNLIEFCKKNNQIWIFGSHDCACTFIDEKKHRDWLIELDKVLPVRSLVLFFEADISDKVYANHLQSARVLIYRNWHFSTPIRPFGCTLNKTNCKHDYLLTMAKRPGRPHRQLLWDQLCKRPNLVAHGLAKYHIKDTKNWVGEKSRQHTWHAGHASMDLYSQCWLEIVPETCYKNLYFFTEKTRKPIVTQTPFLMVSTAGYLAWLQSQGFLTFHSLIDEGYDKHYRIQDRVSHMVDVLEDIISNGTEAFYQASRPILQHNFNRLCEISESWQRDFDSMMWQVLENAKIDTGTMPERQCIGFSSPDIIVTRV